MNFSNDDDDDGDFFGSQTTNKLASLFKSTNDSTTASTNESLKYKAPKQPQTTTTAASTSSSNPSTATSQSSSSIPFFSAVQVFKYINNKYEPQGKLGLAILSSQNIYRILMYVTKSQPIANIRLTGDFKLSVQKNNYASFYDESKNLWSVLFDNEDLVISFATQITLCKCNIFIANGNTNDCLKVVQDLKVNDNDAQTIDSGDSIECGVNVVVWKDFKLGSELENTIQKPVKLKLGKNKLPTYIENAIIGMRQENRRLFVINGAHLQSFYPNSSSSSIVFYDINIIRVKKNKETSSPSVTNAQIDIPEINSTSNTPPRSRAESTIKDKSKIINEQLTESKLNEKAKLISRMAKMGQQMLPGGNESYSMITENEDDWDKTATSAPLIVNSNNIQDTVQTALLLQQQQNQQLQQQLAIQQQQQQQQQFAMQQVNSFNQAPNNQLALSLFRSNQANQVVTQANPQFITSFGQVTQSPINNQGNFSQSLDPNQNQQRSESETKFLSKLEVVIEKLDQIKSITQVNNQNLPNMETNILLQNIQRIVKENEQYKKELYEKGNKIEEQNTKITELLMKAQNYVEQSHQILEQKNSSFQNNAERNQMRVLELEQDKMRLTGDLSNLTAKISELNLEINRMQKSELEMKQHLTEVSKNTDTYKQTSERVLVENADLQTKLDTVMSEIKKERQLRKSIETKAQLNDEELNELRSNLTAAQRLIEEKKRKFDQDKDALNTEADELKRLHANEINLLKEKLNRLKNNANEVQSEQVKQIEADLNREWQLKLDKSILQMEQKYERRLNALNEEKTNIQTQLDDTKELMKTLKKTASSNDTEIDQLKQSIEDLTLFKEKYERLQSQAIIMKERYEGRIKELLNADPDPEIIEEEVKKVMNVLYRKLKTQIKGDEYYSGNGILTGLLKIIKIATMLVLHSEESLDESQINEDFFSSHVYALSEQAKLEVQIRSPTSLTESKIEEAGATKEIIASALSDSVQQIDEAIFEKEPINETLKSENEISTKIRTESQEKVIETKAIFINEHVQNQGESSSEDDIQLINDEEQNEILNQDIYAKQSVNPLYEEENQNELSDIKNDASDNNEKQDTKTNDDLDGEKLDDMHESENSVQIKSNDEENLDDFSSPLKEMPPSPSPSPSPSPPPPAAQPTVNPILPNKVKSLFDDDDDEDDDGIFNFSSNVTTNPKRNADDDKQTRNNEDDKKTNDNEVASPQVKSNEQSHDESKEDSIKTQPSSTTTTSVNLKFSPPPLFDDEKTDDKNNDDIDWFA